MLSAQLRSLAGDQSASTTGNSIELALRSIRQHLGMDVAYVSEFVGDRTVFRHIDAPGFEHFMKVGDSHSVDDVYCLHILEGRLPNLICDTQANPFAAAMPLTKALPIGKHMSVPLKLPDGEIYGMFCCLGPQADHSLNDRDLNMMRVFAELAANEIQRDVVTRRVRDAKLQRIMDAMNDGLMSTVYQPIVGIEQRRIVGFECLSRFKSTPYRTPDIWFKEADEVGSGVVLEIAAIRLALAGLTVLPDHIYLGVNASPATIVSDAFHAALEDMPKHRIVLEITEHAEVKDYDRLIAALHPLRVAGVRVAVDDAGAGYSGLQHILKLDPDLIKLDLSLTRNIDQDLARRALAEALVRFSAATDSQVVAEGVETEAELCILHALGVPKAQGYLLGKPSSLADALCSLQYGSAIRPEAGANSLSSGAADCAACAKEYAPSLPFSDSR